MSRALIVTASDDLYQKSRALLDELGLDSVRAVSLIEALQLLCENSDISIVVADRRDQELEKLIGAMNKEKSLAQVPVIVLGEFQGLRSISELLKLGARAFIPKPLLGRYFAEYVLRYTRAG